MRNLSFETLSRAAAIAVPLLLFLTLASWAFASTVGSSPDDNFHLASIWCGQGLREGLCEDSGDPATRLVPIALIDATCYAHYASISGVCWDPHVSGLGEATWLNTGALYPPVFYATMSFLASEDVQTAVLLMRLTNALLAVVFISAVFFALPKFARPALLVSTVVTMVPLGMFILASTNPSSWATIAAGTVWICVYGALRTTGRRQIVLCALSLLGALIGAGARADAAVFAVFGVALGWILGARRGRSILLPGITAGVTVIACGLLFSRASQGGSATTGLGVESDGLTFADHVSNLLGIPGLWVGVFGSVPLGWLDTTMPQLVPVLAFGAFCASIAVGVRLVGPRRGTALLLTAAALWATPMVLLAQSNLHVADNFVQPRYILPLMVILLGIASLAPRAGFEWSPARIAIVGSALSISASLALHVNLRRYTTGADRPSVDPGADAEWWWTGAPAPLAVWVVGSVAFMFVFVILALLQSAALGQQNTSTATDSPPAVDPLPQGAVPTETWLTAEKEHPDRSHPLNEPMGRIAREN